MSKGKLKLVIENNAAVKIDMSNFNNCSDKTKELMKEIDMEVERMDLKQEEVQTVTTNNQTVRVRS